MKLFFELLQVAIGRREQLSECPTETQWQEIYDICRKQALIGIGWYAIEKLPKEQRPHEELLFLWMGMAQKIVATNELVIDAARKVTKKLQRDGFDCCILKGAGNIVYYNWNGNDNVNFREYDQKVLPDVAPAGRTKNFGSIEKINEVNEKENDKNNKRSTLHSTPYTLHSETGLGMYRSAGDVDVWMIPREGQDVIKYAKQAAKERGEKKPKIDYNHARLPDCKGIEVEGHFFPAFLNSPIRNIRINKWTKTNTATQVNNICEYRFAIPTPEFSIIYQLLHIYRHLIKEGIGMRQLLDYYMIVLRFNENKETHNTIPTLKYLGLEKIAKGVMYIMQEIFLMKENELICKPNKKVGEFLLNEIMTAGNFGKHDPRLNHSQSFFPRTWDIIKHESNMLRFFPEEAICDPFFRVYHKFWQLFH